MFFEGSAVFWINTTSSITVVIYSPTHTVNTRSLPPNPWRFQSPPLKHSLVTDVFIVILGEEEAINKIPLELWVDTQAHFLLVEEDKLISIHARQSGRGLGVKLFKIWRLARRSCWVKYFCTKQFCKVLSLPERWYAWFNTSVYSVPGL